MGMLVTAPGIVLSRIGRMMTSRVTRGMEIRRKASRVALQVCDYADNRKQHYDVQPAAHISTRSSTAGRKLLDRYPQARPPARWRPDR
jgi:hypothetical protein